MIFLAARLGEWLPGSLKLSFLMKHARVRFALASAALCLALACALIGDTALAAGSDTTWTLAGTGEAVDSGDGGQAREAAINQPRSVFPTANGGYVWAEPWSNKVRIVGPDGVIDTLAGTGAAGFDGDGGSAAAAKLNFVHAAAPTPDGGYLLADELNNRIRKVSAGGVITTVAGTGAQGYAGDGGPATAAAINNPRGVVSLPDGGFLIPGFEQPSRPEGFSERNHHDRCGNGRAGVRRRRGPSDRRPNFRSRSGSRRPQTVGS